jgi:hypothetical protein
MQGGISKKKIFFINDHFKSLPNILSPDIRIQISSSNNFSLIALEIQWTQHQTTQ